MIAPQDPEWIAAIRHELVVLRALMDQNQDAPYKVAIIEQFLFAWDSFAVLSDPLLVPEDTGSLPPLTTARQTAIFAAIRVLVEQGERPTAKAIIANTGILKPHDAIEILIERGYVRRAPGIAGLEYHPCTIETPVVKPETAKVLTLPSTIVGDPEQGRSALDKRQALDALNPIAMLKERGHICRRVTYDIYELDGKTVHLPMLLNLLNVYRRKAKMDAINVGKYIA